MKLSRYSMDENEISTWLNSDSNGPGFQLIADDEICYHVLSEQVPAQEDEPKPEEGESNVCPNGVRITEGSLYFFVRPVPPTLRHFELAFARRNPRVMILLL